MQHNYLHYNTKKQIQYSAATINTTYNGVLTRLRYKYVYHLQYIGILGFPMGTNTGTFFSWFNTMQRKQNLASALGIQKENWW